MLRNSYQTPLLLTLMTASLASMAIFRPIRSEYSAHYQGSIRSITDERVLYLQDWMQAEPGLSLLIGLIFTIAAVWVILMLITPGAMYGQVQNYLFLQAGVGMVATLGIVALAQDFQNTTFHSGFTALWVLGLWSSIGSALWASGRLDQWLLRKN